MDELTPENMDRLTAELSDEEKEIVNKIEAIRVGMEELVELLALSGYREAGQGVWYNARRVFLSEVIGFFLTRDSARRTRRPRRYDYFEGY
jgi:hypothetical protein